MGDQAAPMNFPVWYLLAAPCVIVATGVAMFPLFRVPEVYAYEGRHRR
jgi:hypothetical protein